MKLVDSLLDAISRLEADALIMHVGEKPYVVTTSASMNAYRGPVAWGHVELSSRVLTTEAVLEMLVQLLPVDQRQALDDYGAIEFELPDSGPSSDRFTIVAARGGDDVWLEVRRKPAVLPPAESIAEAPKQAMPPPVETVPAPTSAEATPIQHEVAVHAPVEPETIAVPPVVTEPVPEISEPMLEIPEPMLEISKPPEPAAVLGNDAAADDVPFEVVEEEPQLVPTHAEVDALLTASAAALLSAASVKPVNDVAEARPVAEAPQPESRPQAVEEPRQAVVLPLSRSPISAEPPSEVRTTAGPPLERVLRIAAARGAATVYIVAQSQPVIRVDGEISVLDGEPALTAAEVERLVMDLAPARGRDAAPAGEWMADVPDVGRVRCVTFRDHRGPGVIFRMIPPKAISADQLGLAPEVQALCAQPDGLVLVTGSRASGKSTLLSAFVDLINRTRSDHVITIESQIGFVHESRRSFVSQREVRGAGETAAGAVRSAFREDPDVLVIEDMRTPEIVSAALEAAESGRLVFGSVSAPSTVAALDRLIEMFPLDRRAQAQTSLAGALRGVVAQTLLRKVRGGRIAAREILLNTPAVASLILEGKTFQLPVALDSGRRHGMMPLQDSLAALVRDGTVHAAEAYRKAPDRAALLAALRRDGVDTSFAERLA